MSLTAVDCANYTGELPAHALAAWKALGVALVIVQAVDPPPGYPPCVDRQQAQAVLDAGLALGAYVYHWTGTEIAHANAARFASYGFPVERWWADFEDTRPADKAQRETECWDLLAYLDTLGGKRPAGAYSGPWWTSAYLPGGSRVFEGRAGWVSLYNGVDTPDVMPIAGCTPTIHQYAGTSTLCGVGNVDLNAALESEWLMDVPTPDYATALASVTAADGEIVPVLRRIAATPRLLLKARAELGAVADRLLAVHDEFLGP